MKEIKMAEARIEAISKFEAMSNHPDTPLDLPDGKYDHLKEFISTQPLNPQSDEFIPVRTVPETIKSNIANTQLPQPKYNDKPHTHQGTISDQLLLSRLPAPEPGVFSGDPLHYPSWKSAFHALIESRVHYLKRYLAGMAKETVESYFLLMTDDAYEDAKLFLDERFGDTFVIANAFRDKLDRWPKIASRDGTAMRKFADFLKQCSTAMGYMRCLDVLNDDRENRKLLGKLPDWLVNGWARYVYKWKTGNGCFPPFAEFASFLSREADIACDPITSLQSLRGSADASKRREDRTKSHASSSFSTDAKIKTLDNDTRSKCTLCQGNHTLDNCKTFLAKTSTRKEDICNAKGSVFRVHGTRPPFQRMQNA